MVRYPPRRGKADELARETKGRVEIFDARRPGGLDNWTMDLAPYEAMRNLTLEVIDDEGGDDGTVLLKEVVAAAQHRYGSHELFSKGRLTNYVRYTKVDLEARCEIERIPGTPPTYHPVAPGRLNPHTWTRLRWRVSATDQTGPWTCTAADGER